MTVFKTYFKISKKYIGNILMYTAIFLSIVLLISQNNTPTSPEDFSEEKINLSIFCNDQSALSKGLVNYLQENHNVIELENNLDVFRDALYQREVSYILTIPAGFGERVTNGSGKELLEVYKIPGSINSQFLDMSIETFLSTYNAYLIAGMNADEAYDKTIATLDLESTVTIFSKEDAAPLSPIHNFFIYLPYALICVIILSIGPVLFVFHNEERKARIRCSKLSNLGKNGALLAASGIYTILIVLIYCVISLIFYKGELLNLAGLLRILNALIHAFVCLAFTFLFSMLVKNSNMLNMFSNVFGLGSSFLCGIFVPRAMLSASVAAFGRFLPAYWYVNVEDALCNLSPSVTSTITTGYLVQILYGVAVLAIALVIGQYQRKR